MLASHCDSHSGCAPVDPTRISCFTSRSALALLGVALLSAGCASYHARPLLDSGTASSFLEHQARDGLHVAVLDFSAPRATLKHFDRELPDYRYVPVRLLVELDRASTDAFHLRREDLNLVVGDGRRLSAADPVEVIDSVSFSHWRSFFGYLLLLPGPFVQSTVNGANEELETDYLDKSLRSVRLSPNLRSYDGIVFFELPAESSEPISIEDAYVEITVYKESSGDGSLGQRLEFPVHFSNAN